MKTLRRLAPCLVGLLCTGVLPEARAQDGPASNTAPAFGAYEPGPAYPFGRPNPDAPPELEQFAFMIGAFDCVDQIRQRDGSWLTFDFWIGEWSVNNRFLQEDGSWVDGGAARVKIFPLLGGKAILEFWDGRFDNGYVLRGFSLRYYDAATEKWQLALNWPGPNRPGFSELSGAFRHGRGDFFSRYTNADSVDVLQRYTFADVIRSFIPDRAAWVELQLDDRPGTGYLYQAGAFDGDAIELAGFVPPWYKGAPPKTVKKTTWTRQGGNEVRIEVATSEDDGATWTTTETVALTRQYDG